VPVPVSVPELGHWGSEAVRQCPVFSLPQCLTASLPRPGSEAEAGGGAGTDS